MTPEEKAREIADFWLLDAEVNGFLSAQEDGGLAEAIAAAIREAVAEKEAENKRLREALLDPSGPFAVVPAVAPDAAFDAAWERLKTEPHVKLAQRISLHDARMLFRAVWSAMVCACDAGEKERVDRVRVAARAALKGEEA
jgi:hypothetical protein